MPRQTAPALARATGFWMPVAFAVALAVLSTSAVATSNTLWSAGVVDATAPITETR